MTPDSEAPLLEISAVSALKAVAPRYHALLKASPIALQSLKWRGSVARDLVEHFQLGLSDGTLEEALDARSTAGALLVPVVDETGHVVQLRGGEYYVVSGARTKERFFPRGIDAAFHLAGFAVSEELIVTSTAMDSLRLWYAGHVNVSALGEDLALTEAHLAAMKRAGTKRVVLALSAGANADAIAIAAAGRLDGAGIQAYRATIGRRFMPTSRRWGELLRAATPMLGAPARPELPRIDLDWSRLPKKESR